MRETENEKVIIAAKRFMKLLNKSKMNIPLVNENIAYKLLFLRYQLAKTLRCRQSAVWNIRGS